MASFGNALDLLDDRYLNLQDVKGNVQPVPTLVPYEQYTQTVLVYKMSTEPDLFMGLLQESTTRMAEERHKELWTWCVQWDVDPFVLPAHSPKKPRLGEQQDDAASASRGKRDKKIVERRIIDPKLLMQEEALRIMMGIAQAESSILPNFIEFLYRWVDYYLGDGRALRAALRREIPSLWDFEYHPLVVPEDIQKMKELSRNYNTIRARDWAEEEGSFEDDNGQSIREKPDLAAFLRRVEETGRLHYREVKYGIQPPKLDDPLPPLINIPRNKFKRTKYFAACFRSRQRALDILFEAGIVHAQVENFTQAQLIHPKYTPSTGNGRGLDWYRKDSIAAQDRHYQAEIEMALKEKSMEVTISNKLAAEAQLAAEEASSGGSSGAPLIPATPNRKTRFDEADKAVKEPHTTGVDYEEKINLVPTQLLHRMKSKLFAESIDRRALDMLGRWPRVLPRTPALSRAPSNTQHSRAAFEESDSDGSEMDFEYTNGQGTQQNAQPSNAAAPLTNTWVTPLPSPSLHAPPNVASSQLTSSLGMSAINSHSALASSGDSATQTHPTSTGSIATSSSFAPNSSNSLSGTAHGPGHFPRLPVLPVFPKFINEVDQDEDDLFEAEYDQFTMETARRSRPPTQSQTSNGQPSNSSWNQQWAQSSAPMPPSTPALPPGFYGSSAAPQQWNSQSQTPTSNINHVPPIVFGAAPSPSPTIQMTGSEFNQQHHQQALAGLIHALQPITRMPTSQGQLPHTPSSGSLLQLPHQGMNRNAPLPLSFAPQPPSPLSSLSHGLSQVSPIAPSAPFRSAQSRSAPLPVPPTKSTPIQIYFPRVVIPGNLMRVGSKLGDNNHVETDALLLGTCIPGSGKLVFRRAVFLPVGMWPNTLGHAQVSKYTVLEAYGRPGSRAFPIASSLRRAMDAEESPTPHSAAYHKLAQAYNLIARSKDRENDLTKRWRATPGPMTPRDRGAVWEGWATTLDREIELRVNDRLGAYSWSRLIDFGLESKQNIGHWVGASEVEVWEKEMRKKVIDELLRLSGLD